MIGMAGGPGAGASADPADPAGTPLAVARPTTGRLVPIALAGDPVPRRPVPARASIADLREMLRAEGAAPVHERHL
ncbi:MAG: hypothetical protein EHM87_21625, partial [Burkholderiales bacterium]